MNLFVPTTLCIEDRRLDLAAHVFIHADGYELPLTRAEAALLKELARGVGEVRSRDQLRYAVAGRGADPFDRSVDMLVARLRHKIEPDPKAPRFIITVPGVGYKLMARPQSTEKQISGAKPTESERRQLTVLSCNLVGSAALAAHCDPEDLSSVIRNFQASGAAVIERMGGTIATLTADAILAYFGYPESSEHDAERAVHAGTRSGGKSRPARIAQGRAVAGAGGHSHRYSRSQSRASSRGTASCCCRVMQSGGPEFSACRREHTQTPWWHLCFREYGAIPHCRSFQCGERLPRRWGAQS